MTSDDLVTWLCAQLDEEEFPDWHHRDCQTHRTIPLPPPLGGPMSCNCGVPVRVHAEVAAKRRILDEIVPLIDQMDAQIESEWGSGLGPTGESDPLVRLLVRLLALPYDNRPGYREDWRP